MKCSVCQAEVAEFHTRCRECGTKVGAAPPSAPADPMTAPRTPTAPPRPEPPVLPIVVVGVVLLLIAVGFMASVGRSEAAAKYPAPLTGLFVGAFAAIGGPLIGRSRRAALVPEAVDVKATEVAFPALCCCCGEGSGTHKVAVQFRKRALGGAALGLAVARTALLAAGVPGLVGRVAIDSARTGQLKIPVCQACHRHMVVAPALVIAGLFVGFAVFFAIVALHVKFRDPNEKWEDDHTMAHAAVGAILAMIGTGVAGVLAFPKRQACTGSLWFGPPVSITDLGTGTYRFEFGNRRYCDSFIAANSPPAAVENVPSVAREEPAPAVPEEPAPPEERPVVVAPPPDAPQAAPGAPAPRGTGTTAPGRARGVRVVMGQERTTPADDRKVAVVLRVGFVAVALVGALAWIVSHQLSRPEKSKPEVRVDTNPSSLDPAVLVGTWEADLDLAADRNGGGLDSRQREETKRHLREAGINYRLSLAPDGKVSLTFWEHGAISKQLAGAVRIEDASLIVTDDKGGATRYRATREGDVLSLDDEKRPTLWLRRR